MNNNKQTQGRFGLPSPSKIIEAAVQRIGKFVLHRHLAHWRPISTAPNNHDVELRIKDENVIARLSFPCRQTNTGAWINADLGTSLHIQPIAWRLWQKAGSLQSHSMVAPWHGRAPFLQRGHVIRAIGAMLVMVGIAAWTGAAHSQLLAMNGRNDAGVVYRQAAPDHESDSGLAFPARLHRQIVDYRSADTQGAIIIDTPNTYLYFILGGGKAIRYGIGIGREGFTWSGVKNIERKSEWPDWIPPAEMLQRQPYLPRFMAGGPGNPLGARAMYLAGSVYRIHGTNAPGTIGKQVSSGCIRMLNDDVIDLYDRIHVGTKVVVLPMRRVDMASRPLPLTGY
jgi:lipoprotein-anchoring transpeptidase ErfK/SrfK